MEANWAIRRRGRRANGDPDHHSFIDSYTHPDSHSYHYRYRDADTYLDENAQAHAHPAAYFYAMISVRSVVEARFARTYS